MSLSSEEVEEEVLVEYTQTNLITLVIVLTIIVEIATLRYILLVTNVRTK